MHNNRTALSKLKEQWDENPLLVIGVIGAGITAVSRLIDSFSGIQSRRAYARRAKRRK